VIDASMPTPNGVLACPRMGSNRIRPRKKKGARHQPQHLPKVGSATENERLLHEEQHAVLDQMGVGRAGTAAKTIVTALIVVLVVGALLGFTLLTIWR
jgi:hypothetical protein